jgi:hypothetical protein
MTPTRSEALHDALALFVGEWNMAAASRGIARVYKTSIEDGLWKLWRDEPDFSPLDFSQRFTGTFSADGKTIAGRWEICHDGKTWEHDFDLTYTKA